MSFTKEFERALNKLFSKQTAKLKTIIGKRNPGPVPIITRNKQRRAIGKITEIARHILIRRNARKEFQSIATLRGKWHVSKRKGTDRKARKLAFRKWYDDTKCSKNCIYIFWSNKKCLYVGRTIRGKGRPSSYFDKYWFGRVNRIDIYSVTIPSVVAKAECLAIDRFNPRRNVYSSSRPKFSKKCPICSSERKIRTELKRIFPLRRKSKSKK